MNHSVTRSALHTEIFKFIAACPGLQCTAFGVHRQFTCLGYSETDINRVLTELQHDGSLSLTDVGLLIIGDDTAKAA